MDQYWTDTFEGMRDAGQGLIKAVAGLERAIVAAQHAHDEHGDMRETINRLESTVAEQGDKHGVELRALRDELAALRARLEGRA